MTDEFTVRRYDPSDAERVWTVHEQALRASPMTFVEDAPADDDITNIADQYLDSGEFLVGTVEDDIVAMGGYNPQDDETAEIRRMRVHPDYQGHGYGERILRELEQRLRATGYEEAVLYTNEHLKAARSLYEKYGYEETGRETIQVTGDELIYYRKRLAPENATD